MESWMTTFRRFFFRVFLFGGATRRLLAIAVSSMAYSLGLVLLAVLFTVEPDSVTFTDFLTGIQSPMFRRVVWVLGFGIYTWRALFLGRFSPAAQPQVQ